MSVVVRVAVALLAQNRLMREALTRILGRRGDITLVGSFGFSPTAVDEIAQASADVLVMDWPGNGQFEILRKIQFAEPTLKIVLVGMNPDEQLFVHVVREGVFGYVLGD